MRRVKPKGMKQSDRMWSKVYSRQADLRNVNILPKKVVLIKSNGETKDITTEYIQGYAP
jgi:hypothetical protein